MFRPKMLQLHLTLVLASPDLCGANVRAPRHVEGVKLHNLCAATCMHPPLMASYPTPPSQCSDTPCLSKECVWPALSPQSDLSSMAGRP